MEEYLDADDGPGDVASAFAPFHSALRNPRLSSSFSTIPTTSHVTSLAYRKVCDVAEPLTKLSARAIFAASFTFIFILISIYRGWTIPSAISVDILI
jgi:hypothetical protein|tara:strand:- start:190 stop:480 length:291 start_codon:yes stop_codon:yes gene_type:complete